jgi:hypothetical protein
MESWSVGVAEWRSDRAGKEREFASESRKRWFMKERREVVKGRPEMEGSDGGVVRQCSGIRLQEADLR